MGMEILWTKRTVSVPCPGHSLPSTCQADHSLPHPSPAFFALQQFPIGCYFDVQGHLDVQKLLVLTQVPRHLFL